MSYHVCFVDACVIDTICCNNTTAQHNAVHIICFEYLVFTYVLFHKDCVLFRENHYAGGKRVW